MSLNWDISLKQMWDFEYGFKKLLRPEAGAVMKIHRRYDRWFFCTCSKGCGSTLRVWELMVCLLYLAFMSATIRNCLQPSARGRYGPACGKFCKRGHFRSFHTLRGFMSRGRGGTSCHSDVFHTACRKSFCVAGVALPHILMSKVMLCGKRNTSVYSILRTPHSTEGWRGLADKTHPSSARPDFNARMQH